MTIHAVGLSVDNTMRRFVAQAVRTGHEIAFVDLHRVVEQPWRFVFSPDDGNAVLHDPQDGQLPLPRDGRYYLRVIDLSPVLPEEEAQAWRHLTGALLAYFDSVAGMVINRPGAQSHNGTKPLHEWWLSSRGFAVPASLTTADRDRIHAFLTRRARAIVKTVCGARSTAQLVEARDFESFTPEAGPVHIQEWIEGFDVRVHLVRDHAFGERIDSDTVDYRDKASHPHHQPIEVPPPMLSRMCEAAEEMGLTFTGWDFRVDPSGRWWCLEVNPMPGYGSYDWRCDGAISAALCRVLES